MNALIKQNFKCTMGISKNWTETVLALYTIVNWHLIWDKNLGKSCTFRGNIPYVSPVKKLDWQKVFEIDKDIKSSNSVHTGSHAVFEGGHYFTQNLLVSSFHPFCWMLSNWKPDTTLFKTRAEKTSFPSAEDTCCKGRATIHVPESYMKRDKGIS